MVPNSNQEFQVSRTRSPKSSPRLLGLPRRHGRGRDETAHARRWPGDETKSVGAAFAEEKPRPLPLPNHSFETDLVLTVCSKKSIYVRFDKNDYASPHLLLIDEVDSMAAPYIH